MSNLNQFSNTVLATRAGDVVESGGFDPLPAGEYVIRLNEANVKNTKNNEAFCRVSRGELAADEQFTMNHIQEGLGAPFVAKLKITKDINPQNNQETIKNEIATFVSAFDAMNQNPQGQPVNNHPPQSFIQQQQQQVNNNQQPFAQQPMQNNNTNNNGFNQPS